MSVIDPGLEAILRCPVSGGRLRRMTPEEIAELNRMIAVGEATYGDGKPRPKDITAGLISEDGRYAYRDEEGVLFLLKDWAIFTETNRREVVDLDEGTKSVRDFYDDVGWKTVTEGMFADAVRYEDLRPVSARYIHECHLRVLRYIDSVGQYLLDAGSGPVQYSEYLAYSQGYGKRICIDVSLAALREAQRTLQDRGFYILADISNLPLADCSMDGVVSLHTIYHISKESQEKAVREIHRVLLPGRRAAIVYSWKNSSFNQVLLFPVRLKRLLARALHKVALSAHQPTEDPGTNDASVLFAEPQSYRWFASKPWDFEYEVGVWRTVNVEVLRLYIHDRLFGRQLLRALFALEERFPRLFATIGQYGIISIRK